jgi:anti-sigma B factor antagonist
MESSILSALADDGTATVTVRGEIDFSNADELAGCLRAAVTDWSPPTLRVDLAQASFFDSTGLGALIDGYRAAVEADIRYIVVHPTEGFQRVLSVTGLSELFGLEEDSSSSFEDHFEEEEAAQATGA